MKYQIISNRCWSTRPVIPVDTLLDTATTTGQSPHKAPEGAYRVASPGAFALFIFLFFSCTASATQEEAFTESVIIFNTVCAKCHEAQCSGRLSFDQAQKASRQHIVRYYGPASRKKWLQEELFAILNYMKQKCAYYPTQFPIPPRRVWNSSLLEKMRTLTEKDYFVPLGVLNPGRYELKLELAEDVKSEIHLISESFEMVVEDCYQSTNRRVSIPFSIAETENYYFRLYARQPLTIRQLTIKPSNASDRWPE